MWLISFTKRTSQFEISPLKVVFDEKALCISVTELTSHSDMTPYVVVTVPYVVQSPFSGSSFKHEFTAVWKFACSTLNLNSHESAGPSFSVEHEYFS